MARRVPLLYSPGRTMPEQPAEHTAKQIPGYTPPSRWDRIGRPLTIAALLIASALIWGLTDLWWISVALAAAGVALLLTTRR